MCTDVLTAVYGQQISHAYPNVSLSIERITPDVAKEMLERNIANRDRKREPIVKAIKDGEWLLNGATIVFSDKGVLLDGQNRLYACISSGIPIDTIVVRGIKIDAQETMDTNVKRSVRDYLKMRGYPDYTLVGAMGASLYRAELLGIESAFCQAHGNEATIKGTLKYIENNYEKRIAPIKTLCRSIAHKYRGFNSGTSAILLDEFSKAGDENMRDFARKLVEGDQTCNAIFLLSKQLTTNALSRTGKLPQRVIAALCIKSWNSYIRGTEMHQLRFMTGGARPEQFPEILFGYDYVGNDAS